MERTEMTFKRRYNKELEQSKGLRPTAHDGLAKMFSKLKRKEKTCFRNILHPKD